MEVETFKLNKNGESIEEIFDVDTVVGKAAAIALIDLERTQASILGSTLQLVTGVPFENKLDILEYLMKSLSEEEFIQWAAFVHEMNKGESPFTDAIENSSKEK